MRARAGHTLGFVLAALLAACAGPTEPSAIRSRVPIVFSPQPVLSTTALPGFAQERKAEVVAAFASGCNRLDPAYTNACIAARNVAPGDEAAATRFLADNFNTASLGSDLVTGYFELTVPGSLTPDARFTVPVYRTPRDPQRYSRADIMGGALSNQRLELVYLQSEADLYFLQLQGSGRITLPDGSLLRLGTAASNGRPRTPVASLFANAPIPGRDLSIPGIRGWANQDPVTAHALLAPDQVYVFFRTTQEIPQQYGPYGAFGLPLLPLRSVAVDPRTAPLGTMLWISAANTTNQTLLPHLVIAHDTGDLINGPGRIDIFYGWGPQAEQDGGHENTTGQVWALIPR